MSAAGRGFMNNLSNERLLQRLQQFEAAGSDARAMDDSEFADECEDVACVIRELLALREAGKEPVGSFHITDQEVEATTDYVKPGEWPIDNGELLVYAAPQLPAVTTEMAQAGGIVVAECEAHGEHQDDTARKVFAAMIAAAPKPE